VDAYLKKLGSPYKALVAFTDVVKDAKVGKEYTEAKMNGFPEAATGDRFEADDYRFLIVASKFQTGFDQPKLLAMYVDKKLSGVACVQTLSRLNRTTTGKDETFVLDFENTTEDIEKGFQPFYDRVTLSKETDPNQLYNIRTDLDKFAIHTAANLEAFAKQWFAAKPSVEKLHAVVDPVAEKWKAASEEEQVDYKSKARDYVKLYAFMSHLVPLRDTGLEKLAVFLRFLLPKLPAKKGELPLEVLGMVDIGKLAVRQKDKKDISLQRGESKVDALNYGGGAIMSEEERESLSKIIEDLNERFNTSFSEDEIMVIKQLEKKISEDEALQQQLRNGAPLAVKATFQQVARDAFEDLVNDNFKFYQKVSDDDEVSKEFFSRLFEWYLAGHMQSQQKSSASQ
jgi:type I restriction enzyme R subunit